MRNLLKIKDCRRSGSINAGLRGTMGIALLSALVGGLLIGSVRAEKSQPPMQPTNSPGILIVPRQLAPVPKPVVPKQAVRSNISTTPAPIRQLAYTTAAASPASRTKRRANKTGVVIVPAADHTTYGGAYTSILFSRAEFEANPSYRHEAAMEILFNKLRPMVVHKSQPRKNPRRFRPQSRSRFRFDSYGHYRFGGGGFGGGISSGGIFGGGYRNYNFYYPRPTIYRSY